MTSPNWQPWLVFFLKAMQQQMQRLAKKVEREKIVLSHLPELSVQILEQVRAHGRMSMGDMIKRTGVSRNTLKEHFRTLTEKNHLIQRGNGQTTWYTLP